MKKRLNIFLIALFSLMLVLSGCTTTTSQSTAEKDNKDKKDSSVEETSAGKKVLRANNHSEPGALHPGLALGSHDSWILDHVFEGLATKDSDGTIIPGMAETWETSEDGLTWTFHLKDSVNWSNGEPVTAQDFEYAWKFAMDPNSAATYAYQFYYIEGAEEFNNIGADVLAKYNEELEKAEEEGKTPPEKPVIPEDQLGPARDKVGVKALDDKTLEVKLTSPTAYFIDLMTFFSYYPINKKLAESNPDWYKEPSNYVSNGAFKLTEWKHKESITLSKNDKYYAADKVKLDEVLLYIIEDQNTAWQMYETGEIDLLDDLPAEVTGMMVAGNRADFHNAAELATYYYNLNAKVKPFNNPKVRKALSMAIDRKTITEHVTQGGQLPAYGVVPPGMPDVSGDFRENGGALFEENVEEAKKLLAEGLAEEGLTEFPEVTLLYNNSVTHKGIAEAVQEMWRKNLGIEKLLLENVEFQVKLDREKSGDYQISRAGWIGDYVDPMTYMDLWLTGGANNDANYSNPEYDKLVNKAKASMDQAERMELMHKAEQMLMNEMPIIPVYYYSRPHVYKENVTGIYTLINSAPVFKFADIQN
ncbi:peptide ABC transporter substrate-binding protein [Bacillus sp. S/N-304-OC-R1]|uniref:peptide ABC transporter substrate-binding protein n=1 Tax=Bacillus sp. S/N-304-OC-R1 TaxID=2758034 RepID=UPI001C8E3C4E|nr:peptide ABC transporter substrate-binding protein [Bacillus sp. S/N-304-OC-R1]MBY0124350.1 peptide ABC transporter substrate-binding protein [Bacillus sp. S/N-304-OC-R1]